ncbi:MAG: nucleotidyltransferase domain-containing protein [Candidatus Cloacimonetes bacterium]|nr:nucleotidyltransferase domain-containing protein [Candidatus Cloacimonadota bacterium]
MTDFYKKIVSELKDLYKRNENILAAWEGGSAATGYLDEYSDLDLALITTNDAVEDIFKLTEQFLDDKYGILNKFRMPEPNWHGHSQCFYKLTKSPEFFYVDMLIEKQSAKNRFTESDRHGNSIIWFDNKNLIDPTPTPIEEIETKCKRHYHLMSTLLPFMEMDISKQIKRGNVIDAISIYGGLLNRMAALLNIKYRPHKFDFGLRYYYRDLPKEEIAFVEDIAFVTDLNDLKEKLPKTIKKYKDLVEELGKKYK